MMPDEKRGSAAANEPWLQRLRELPPATATIEPEAVFYQAGYQAALAERSRGGSRPLALLAASLLTAVVIFPGAYRLGRSTVVEQAVAEVSDSKAAVQVGESGNAKPDEPVTAAAISSSGSDSSTAVGADAADQRDREHERAIRRQRLDGFARQLLAMIAEDELEPASNRVSADQPLAVFHSFVSRDAAAGEPWADLLDSPRMPAESLTATARTTLDPPQPNTALSRTMSAGDLHVLSTTMEANR